MLYGRIPIKWLIQFDVIRLATQINNISDGEMIVDTEDKDGSWNRLQKLFLPHLVASAEEI